MLYSKDEKKEKYSKFPVHLVTLNKDVCMSLSLFNWGCVLFKN